MSESLPLTCADCQKLLSIGPDTFDQFAVQNHLASCAMCSRLSSHYGEIDTLLNQIPDLKPLPDLALRFQQVPQARHISELNERFASWEDLLEEKPSVHFITQWVDEAATSSLSQGKKPMQKQPLAPDTGPSHALNSGQFTQPVNPTPHPRRSFWRTIATTAAILVVLVTIFAWGLLPHLLQQNAPAGQGKTAPTIVPTPTRATPTPGLTQQYGFTDQDSGKTVTYTVTSRFEIILNQQKYPQKNVQVSCTPPGTIGPVSNLPYVAPPLYTVRYEGVQPGTCTIKNGSFLLTVIIVQLTS